MRFCPLLIACLLLGCAAEKADPTAHEAHVDLARAVNWLGRADLRDPTRVAFAWSGAGFDAYFFGTGLEITLHNDSDDIVFDVVVDGAPGTRLTTAAHSARYTLAERLTRGPHRVSFRRETEGQLGTSWLTALDVRDGTLSPPKTPMRPLLEVVGDSYSAGYGALGGNAFCAFSTATESFAMSYAGVAARALGADASAIAVSGHGLLRNLDNLAEDLVPALYDRALTNDATSHWQAIRHPDVVVIELGSNDFHAADADPGLPFEDAYLTFIANLRALHPNAWIVCAVGPVFEGERATVGARWAARVAHVVRKRSALGDTRVRSLLFPEMHDDDLGCDYHPNAKKHARMADALTELVRPLLAL